MGTQGDGHLAALGWTKGGVVEMPDLGVGLQREHGGLSLIIRT